MPRSPAAVAPVVDHRRCSGCGRCVAACSLRILSLEPVGYRKQVVVAFSLPCNGCGACVEACPLEVLQLRLRE